LELRDVVKLYRGAGDVVRAVDGVTLGVQPGEFVAVYGPSGTGKTTLLLLAAGFLPPDEGSIRFDGRDLSTLSTEGLATYLRDDIGFVFQSNHLLPGLSAVGNAAVKLLGGGTGLGEARVEAIPWLQRVGLGHRLQHRPAQMSGGERQRVAIARALVGEPRLILADEPTGNLDSRRGAEILSLLAELSQARGAAVVLVTHDPGAAAIADRVLTLRDGRIEEQTPHGLL
jgi:putative ABC transport system ATP-binding protein